MLFPPY